jgi:hypothetical protein
VVQELNPRRSPTMQEVEAVKVHFAAQTPRVSCKKGTNVCFFLTRTDGCRTNLTIKVKRTRSATTVAKSLGKAFPAQQVPRRSSVGVGRRPAEGPQAAHSSAAVVSTPTLQQLCPPDPMVLTRPLGPAILNTCPSPPCIVCQLARTIRLHLAVVPALR